MHNYLPVLIVGAIIGVFTLLFIVVYLAERKRKEAEDSDRHMADRELIRRLMEYAVPYRKEFILVLLLLLFSIAYDLASPLLIGYIEETVKGEFELSFLWTMVALYVGILIVSMVCTYGQSMILQKTGQKILSALREDIFVHIEGLSHGQLSEIPVGKLVTRVTNDTNAISYMFTNILVTLVKNMVVIVGVLAAMMMLNYALTLMVLCFVPFVVFFTVLFRYFSRKVHRRVNNATTDVNTYLSENLSGMKITQVFNQEDRKMEEFRVKSETLRKAKKARIFVFGIFRPMVYMLYISSVMCLFYLGGKGYIDDVQLLGQTVTSGVVVTFYMYISRFYNPIQTLAEQFDMLQRSFAAAEKIFTIMDMAPEITDREEAAEAADSDIYSAAVTDAKMDANAGSDADTDSGADTNTNTNTPADKGGLIELETLRGEIEFQDVWFCYNPGEWVLKGVSFHIYPGQTAAFVGATGSGKSTILSLICRNYDIQKGRILIDGIDIRNIKIASLRRHFGQMLQDVFLFSGSIRSNLTLRDSFTEEEIMEACRYVNADGFIGRLKNGLDEEVLE
ncbi:MAG: ABC transporter ATP-binding protein, partial [Emergencia sp.]|nr:ABC transporter ATP-binding protein [Emergencia sp.]